MSTLFGIRPSRFRIFLRIDYLSILVVIALACGGVAAIHGAASSDGTIGPLIGYARRQAHGAVAGFGFLILFASIDARHLRTLAWPLYVCALGALLLVLLTGTKVNGAVSWLRIPLGPRTLSLQPSEPVKVIAVLAMARLLSERGRGFRGLRDIAGPVLVALAPMGLILRQPDFGTACTFLPMTATMMFVAGFRKWIFVALILLGVGAAWSGYPYLKDYQKDRIQTFLNPGEDALGKGYNILQAQTALGSGGVFGKGWGRGTQTSFRFLPEYQTDFVFPTVGEQFGFVGCATALALYALLILRLVRIASICGDPFGEIAIAGFVSIVVVHLILNLGMVAGLLPVTGLPLPFVSFGRSFLLTCFSMVGIAIGIGARREDRRA